MQQRCNLGYATRCSRLPKERTADAVRFSVARDRGSCLQLWFVCEMGHRPAEHGKLDYDRASGRWASPHPDARIQKMAECYLESYLLRRIHFPSEPMPHCAPTHEPQPSEPQPMSHNNDLQMHPPSRSVTRNRR